MNTIVVLVRRDMCFEFAGIAKEHHVEVLECAESGIDGLCEVTVRGSALLLYLVGRYYARKELLRNFNELAQ